MYYIRQYRYLSQTTPALQAWWWLLLCERVLLVCSGVLPASERLLQVEGHSEGQVVLQLPCNDLHAQRQTLLTHTQRALSHRQPQHVNYTCVWRKKRKEKKKQNVLIRGINLFNSHNPEIATSKMTVRHKINHRQFPGCKKVLKSPTVFFNWALTS